MKRFRRYFILLLFFPLFFLFFFFNSFCSFINSTAGLLQSPASDNGSVKNRWHPHRPQTSTIKTARCKLHKHVGTLIVRKLPQSKLKAASCTNISAPSLSAIKIASCKLLKHVGIITVRKHPQSKLQAASCTNISAPSLPAIKTASCKLHKHLGTLPVRNQNCKLQVAQTSRHPG